MEKIICGIQQMGIGVPDVQGIWKWYRTMFGMDIRIFEDAAEAPLMIKYTGDKIQKRTASLAISMEGGGGFEIWQYTSRPTNKAKFDIQLGDLGTFSCRIKSHDVAASFAHMKANGAKFIGELSTNPAGEQSFFVEDPNGNIFNVVKGSGWLMDTKHPSKCGGVAGALIGVSDIDAALKLYQDVLDYETIVYDETGNFEDLKGFSTGNQKYRRVLLKHKQERKGPFSELLGPTQIELVQALERKPVKIFKDRLWGDWGFIHLCFDVRGMDTLKKECAAAGFPFTVDSGSTFDMGEAGGRFSYIEDPDGNLIEFVETHKVPLMKKLNWYLDLSKRDAEKRLPTWMIKAMRFGNKVS
ncbi:VOC family protein [Putridiphycobacter roseus]|uniref:VOC family protein n=1 Tax=Putridiphycobacter roseus TaxID=2219161 RepID=A0A2W1NM29_9FLAO|nr:VOC family protein [Putridiphycobacter roseus]PZE15778.1 VOC family protein [Putridiphycobacter roseus]